jgi:hypothetical protein
LALVRPSATRPQVGQLEQFARRRFAAPIVAVTRSGGIRVDHGEARQAAAHSQHQIAGNTLRRGKREDHVGIGIISQRRRKGGIEPGTGEIDRHVEGVAGAADAEAAVAAADEFDDRFSDRDRAWPLLAHGAGR